VPYPFAAGNHQQANAEQLAAAGAARMILDRDLSGRVLLDVISALRRDRAGLERMSRAAAALGRPQALADILDFLAQVSRRTF